MQHTAVHASPPPVFGQTPAHRRRVAGLWVLGAHGLLLWGLLNLSPLQATLHQAARHWAPLTVRLLDAPDTPTPAQRQPVSKPMATPAVLPRAAAPAIPVLPRPDETAFRPAEPAAAAAATNPATAVAVSAAAPPAAAAQPSTVTAAPPEPVQRIAASSLRYRVEPTVVVPRLSRRAREAGTVLLHVVVDVQGLPRSVSLRQSSGYGRLDEQALVAMRAARFVPCTDHGRPVECEADAPIVYELEN